MLILSQNGESLVSFDKGGGLTIRKKPHYVQVDRMTVAEKATYEVVFSTTHTELKMGEYLTLAIAKAVIREIAKNYQKEGSGNCENVVYTMPIANGVSPAK